jgi:hypothetical protein
VVDKYYRRNYHSQSKVGPRLSLIWAPSVQPTLQDPIGHQGLGYPLQNLMAESSLNITVLRMSEKHIEGPYQLVLEQLSRDHHDATWMKLVEYNIRTYILLCLRTTHLLFEPRLNRV